MQKKILLKKALPTINGALPPGEYFTCYYETNTSIRRATYLIHDVLLGNALLMSIETDLFVKFR